MEKWIFWPYRDSNSDTLVVHPVASCCTDYSTAATSVLLLLLCWPPLWSVSQSSWLQIQRPGFDSRRYQIFWEVVGLERGPLSLVSTTEELLERKSSGSGLESREYGRRGPPRCPCGILYPQKLALTSPTSGGRSVGIVRSRTHATEIFYYYYATFCIEKRVTHLLHKSIGSPDRCLSLSTLIVGWLYPGV
jgi:hypothetical protein